MTDIIDINITESSARYITWSLRKKGGKIPFSINSAARVWLSAEHVETGSKIIVETHDALPSNWLLGEVSVKFSRKDLFSKVGDWNYALSVILADEDVPVVAGVITVADRPNDPIKVTGTGVLAASRSFASI